MLYGHSQPHVRYVGPPITPRCLVQANGVAYPEFRVPNPVEIRHELSNWAKLKLTPRDLLQALHRARERIAKAGNFIFTMGNTYINDLLLLEWNNTNIATLGDATGVRGSSTAGSLYVALHTAQPSAASDQTSNEATFTGYARVGAARNSGGWTVSTVQVSNTAAITFAQNTGSDQTVTHFSVGVASSSTSLMLRYGPLVASGATWLPVTCNDAAGDTLVIPSNPFSVNDAIVFQAAYDGSLPTGITAGTVYYVKTSSSNTITISTTVGGSTLDITAVGSGVCIKAKPLTVRGGIDAVQFAASTLVSKLG